MKKIFLWLCFLITFSLGVLNSKIEAHLDAGEDAVVDGYLVDFGYAPEALQAQKPAEIAFNLVDPETEQAIVFDNVWVRIARGEEIVFAGTLHQEIDHVVFSYTFPSGGNYEINARFKNGAEKIVEKSFTVEVAAAENEIPQHNSRLWKIFLAIGEFFRKIFSAISSLF